MKIIRNEERKAFCGSTVWIWRVVSKLFASVLMRLIFIRTEKRSKEMLR
jgi:hypothetical protein